MKGEQRESVAQNWDSGHIDSNPSLASQEQRASFPSLGLTPRCGMGIREPTWQVIVKIKGYQKCKVFAILSKISINCCYLKK